VLTYVIEGAATYSLGSGSPEPLQPGSTKLLTAPSSTSHAINAVKGQTVRWFSLVVALPPGVTGAYRLQSTHVRETDPQPDGTVLRQLVGPRSSVSSAAGLECEVLRFQDEGTVFRRVGHDRRAIAYALSGPGGVDNDDLDAGEAAFIEDAAGISLKGEAGFHVIFSSAPKPPKT
jgi:redox-sensitive bicupin YhaK (pirin superfamily)